MVKKNFKPKFTWEKNNRWEMLGGGGGAAGVESPTGIKTHKTNKKCHFGA